MKIQIGEKSFASKEEAKKAIQTILYRYKPRQEFSPEDAEFIVDVVSLHPEADTKIGPGVKAVFACNVEGYSSRGFFLRRSDESIEQFSFNKCLRPPSPKELVIKALRQLVVDQVLDFKKNAFSETSAIKCPLTGESVTQKDCHVDHVTPFRDLVEMFAYGQGVRLDEATTESGDGAEVKLMDKALADKWIKYHRDNAVLRIVSRKGNLQRKRGKGLEFGAPLF
jgi:hypothetical protein